MKLSHLKYLAFALSASSLLALSACGGGSSENAVVTVSTVTPTTPGTVAIVTSVTPPAGYNAEQLAAYTAFNTARGSCGFGYLQQNKSLDASSAKHAGWMIINAKYTHYETLATPGFSGVTPNERMLAAGYSGGTMSNEVIAATYSSNSAGYGSIGATQLLSAPYHLAGIMGGNREMGVAVVSGGPIGSGADIIAPGTVATTYFVADMASSSLKMQQAQSAGSVLSYPCAGTTGTAWKLEGEIPNPVGTRDLFANPIGQPIYVQSSPGSALIISSVTVTGPGGSVALLPTLTAANDANADLKGSNQAIIMPNLPLSPNTSYAVSIAGTTAGVAFTKSFTFSTGS